MMSTSDAVGEERLDVRQLLVAETRRRSTCSAAGCLDGALMALV